jgi:hypothetical protein
MREHIARLLDDRRFDEVVTLLATENALGTDSSLDPDGIAADLCRFGQRALRLDVLDLDVDLAQRLNHELAGPLAETARGLMFPDSARQQRRGSLTAMRPLMGLVLEALTVRWRRDELLHVLALLHLVGEYLGHIAWESTIDHSGDPLQFHGGFGGAGSAWGDAAADDCGHSRSHRHLARRMNEGDPLTSKGEWDDFLRSDYSRVGGLFLTCATRSGGRIWGRQPRRCDHATCPVWWGLDESTSTSLERRTRVALWFGDSPLLKVRHAAPIGHFFGVPDKAEIVVAFDELAGKLRRQGVDVDGGDDVPSRTSQIVSIVAGEPTPPTDLLAATAEAVSIALS